jgi:RHS repeat-associated protein
VDTIGRLARLTDPLGNATNFVDDPIDGVHQVIDPTGSTTTTTYNAIGLVSSVAGPRGGTTSYAYDTRDRLSTRTDPLSQVDNFTSYDGNGNLLTATDRKGQQATYTYDAFSRPATASYADGSTVTYTWDKGNRLTQIQDSNGGTITRSYDGFDRLTSETIPQGTVSYAYDAAGRPTSMSVSGQSDVLYTFDDADRLTQVSQGSAAVSIGYDNANRRTLLTLPNGVTASYAYDAASELTGITYADGSTSIGTLTYAYDLAGHLVSRSGTLFQSVLPAAVTSASYDADNRLTQWVAPGGGITPTYDANGNLANDGTNSYSWDARNRLTGIGTGASFTYDGAGRRQSTTLGGAAKTYLYDGADVVQELTGGTPSVTLLTGLGVDERFTRTTSAGTSTYLTDLLGTTVALTDNSGTVQTSYGYDPYGNTSALGTANDNSFQFTGRENDGTGLYFYRGRYYNPAWGRFISEDPIGLAGGANLYRYAADNPLQLRDPSGNLPGLIPGFQLIPKIIDAWTHRNDPPLPTNPNPAAAGGSSTASPPASTAQCSTASSGAGGGSDEGESPSSPHIDPQDLAGKTPAEIDQAAKDAGLVPKGPDPQNGQGSYVDPVTGEQRILIHPDDGHFHVNNPEGERLDINGNVVAPNSTDAHLPLGQ